MDGYWISPDGTAFFTNNAENHRMTIMQLGILNELEEASTKMHFSKHELEKFRQYDLPYVAMKLGYVRITSFNGQIGIQFDYNQLDQIICKFKDMLVNCMQTLCNNIQMIYVEDVDCAMHMSFVSLTEFVRFLNNSNCQTRTCQH